MSTWVKICGLTGREAVQAAAEAGADAVGFVFAPSPRRVTPAEARRLCEGLPATVLRVAVMRHPAPADWTAVRDEFAPDWLQTEASDFAGLVLGPNCEALPVFRDDGVMIDAEKDTLPQRMLFEGVRSGAGERADWSLAARLAARTALVLAGGLSAANVAEAMGRVAPWGLDVSSGVEEAPGRKDPARIAEFLRIVRESEGGPVPGTQETRRGMR